MAMLYIFLINFPLFLLDHLSEKERQSLYHKQSKELIYRAEAMLETFQNRDQSIPFYLGVHVEHVKPMFELAWMPMLAGVSACLQASNHKDIIRWCMETMKDAIRIACIFQMDLEKEALIGSLYKFGHLKDLSECSIKNIEAFKTMIQISYMCGNYFRKSWLEVLRSVSELEKIKLIRSRLGGTTLAVSSSNSSSSGSSNKVSTPISSDS
jgi:brefeldin A-inhibited guanine nucleotide-exchange protein